MRAQDSQTITLRVWVPHMHQYLEGASKVYDVPCHWAVIKINSHSTQMDHKEREKKRGRDKKDHLPGNRSRGTREKVGLHSEGEKKRGRK